MQYFWPLVLSKTPNLRKISSPPYLLSSSWTSSFTSLLALYWALARCLTICCCRYCCSVTKLSQRLATPSVAAHQASLSLFTCLSPPPRVCQVHVHWVSDVIQPSHPLSPPSSAFNLSQHQDFSNESAIGIKGQNTGASASASILPYSIQGWFLLRLTGLISLQSKGLTGSFSNTTVWKHQFFAALDFFIGPIM